MLNDWQLPRFLVAGGIAAAANFGSRLLFSRVIPFEYAVVCAFFVGLGTGFVLQRQFVFAASERGLRSEIPRYVAVNMLALLQTWALSVYLAAVLAPRTGVHLAQSLAHATGILLPVASSYIGHKYFTFRAASR